MKFDKIEYAEEIRATLPQWIRLIEALHPCGVNLTNGAYISDKSIFDDFGISQIMLDINLPGVKTGDRISDYLEGMK